MKRSPLAGGAEEQRLVRAVDLAHRDAPVAFDHASHGGGQRRSGEHRHLERVELASGIDAERQRELPEQEHFQRQTSDDLRPQRAQKVESAGEGDVPGEVSARNVAAPLELECRLDAEGDRREGGEAIEEDLSRRPLGKPSRHRLPHDREFFLSVPAGDGLSRRSRRFVIVPEFFARHREHAERRRLAEMVFAGDRQAIEVGERARLALLQMLGVEGCAARKRHGLAKRAPRRRDGSRTRASEPRPERRRVRR